MGFRFGYGWRRKLTARTVIILAGLFIFVTFRSMSRGLAQAAAWEGVVESKEMAYNWEEFSLSRYDTDGFGQRPYVTVLCDDGKTRTAQVHFGAYDLIRVGDRVTKPAGKKHAVKQR